MTPLDTPLDGALRLTAKQKTVLNRIGILTVRDLLWHFPARHEHFSAPKQITDITEGEHASIEGVITRISMKKLFRRRIPLVEMHVRDQSGEIKAIWFNQPYIAKTILKGTQIKLAGQVYANKKEYYFTNPIHSLGEEKTVTAMPIYPEVRGLSSRWFFAQIRKLLPFAHNAIDPIPDRVRIAYNLPPLARALREIHQPTTSRWAEAARKRFAFEEIFFIQLHRARMRRTLEEHPSFHIPQNIVLAKRLTSSLPFPLTNAQKKVAWHIIQDLGRPHPMARLLEGDVGSGKTLVAVIAALSAADARYQVAYMAPTEILARQHFETFMRLLAPFSIPMGLITSAEYKKFPSKINPATATHIARSQLLKWVRSGETRILIGTHALIQKEVAFKNLALVIVDEQHRFGVQQRAQLVMQSSASIPHLLSMTATPIPRTLALTIYGDLDLSLLDEMPPGRKKPITKIVPPQKRTEAYAFIRRIIEEGGQAFVICPKISSEPPSLASAAGYEPERAWCPDEYRGERGRGLSLRSLGAAKKARKQTGRFFNSSPEIKSVEEEYKKLKETVFPDLEIAMLHGKLKPKEKEKIINDFRSKKTHILVSTSVIEVGVDIPNASVIMIEGADRFGLATLHQFRGRVGRAGQQAYCFVFTDSRSAKTRARLEALVKAKNGFELAEYDLLQRGPGELSGKTQWGISDLGMEALKNIKMVEAAREEAKKLLEEDRELKKYPLLKERIEKMEQMVMHFE